MDEVRFSDGLFRGGPITWWDVVHEAEKRLPGANIVVLLEGRKEEVPLCTVIMDPGWWYLLRLHGKKSRLEHVEHIFNKNLEGVKQQWL